MSNDIDDIEKFADALQHEIQVVQNSQEVEIKGGEVYLKRTRITRFAPEYFLRYLESKESQIKAVKQGLEEDKKAFFEFARFRKEAENLIKLNKAKMKARRERLRK